MMRNRLLAGFVVALVMLAGWGAALAQDGALSDEQIALLERVLAARQRLDTFASYAEEASGTETQQLTLTLDDQAIEFHESREWERSQTVINAADGANIVASVRAHVLGEDWPAYTLVAEVREVEGVLYASAAYEDQGDVILPLLPEGWIAVEDVEAVEAEYPTLAALDLGSIASGEISALLEDQARLREMVSDVRLEAVTLEDGAQAEQITLLFRSDALLSLVSDTDDPFVTLLFSSISDASQATMSVTLDADDRALQVRTEFFLAVDELDASTLSPDDFPPGTTLSFSFAGVEDQRFGQFDQAFDPVGAPEDLIATPAS